MKRNAFRELQLQNLKENGLLEDEARVRVVG
jgi:hypothetical protein